jgi:predicted XRE-type DNA-binding protein
MNKSKINLPHIKLVIAHGLAVRLSQRKIAESLNVSQPTISRIARQDDMLEMIQREEDKLMQATESMLAKIRTDPVFLNNYQKEIERQFYKYLKNAFKIRDE